MTTSTKKLQLVLAGDTTGSMAYLRQEMRRAFTREAVKLQNDFGDMDISVMFFGDDANRSEVYPIKVLPFTSDIERAVKFIQDTPNTYGGGPHANYERALYEGRLLKWNDAANKVFLIIGDEVPHGANFVHNDGTTYDWKSELRLLVKMGVKVCGLHCMPGVRPDSKRFYASVAEETGGSYLTLDQFGAIGDLILGVAYQQAGTESLRRFEKEVQAAGRMTRNTDSNFATLAGRQRSENYLKDCKDGLRPVPVGQLQILRSDQDVDIKTFLGQNGFELKLVKRYYQFTKPETVQEYKDVVLYEKASGDLFTGLSARKILGLPESGDVRIKPDKEVLRVYDVFIETASNNRKVLANTVVLVDVSQRKSKRS